MAGPVITPGRLTATGGTITSASGTVYNTQLLPELVIQDQARAANVKWFPYLQSNIAPDTTGTVTFDAFGPGTAGVKSSTSPMTWTHFNSGNGIFVGVTDQTGTTDNVTAVTYGGVSLTKLSYKATSNGGVTFWELHGPTCPTGLNTVSVTFSVSQNHNAGSISVYNADTLGTVFNAGTTGASPTQAVTVNGTTTGGLIVTVAANGGGSTFSISAGGTKRWEQLNGSTTGADNGAGATIPSTGGGANQTVTWTSASDEWAVLAVEVLPPTSGVTGTGNEQLKKPLLNGTGVLEFSGSGGLTVKKATESGTGTFSNAATGGLTLKKAVEAGAGTNFWGTGGLALKKATESGSGSETFSGSGGLRLKKALLSGTGTNFWGTGNLQLKKGLLSATGTLTFSGSGGLLLKKASATGSGSNSAGPVTGSGGLSLKKGTLAGSGSETFSGSGSAALKKAIPAGAGLLVFTATGSLRLKKATPSGAGSLGGVAGSGGIVVKKASALSTGTLAFVATGAVSLKKASPHGSALLVFTGSGSIRLHKPVILATSNRSFGVITTSATALDHADVVADDAPLVIVSHGSKATVTTDEGTAPSMTTSGRRLG